MVSNGSLRIGTIARAVALAGMVSLTGCISVKSGGGPLSPEKAVQVYGQPFRTLSAEERRRFEPIEAELKANQGKDVPIFRFALAGSPWIEGQSASKGVGKAIFTCGFWNAKDRFVDHLATSSEAVTLYTRENVCIPGFPLLWPLWMSGAETYLASTEKQIADRSFCGLGLAGILGGYMKVLAPAYDKQNAVVQIREAAQFNVVKMNWLAAGILGCGRVNSTYYGQVLWIAFPVGDAQ